MSVGPLALELVIVFFLALFLLYHYGNITKQRPVVIFFTLTAWYFSLIIVFILPLDVSSTYFRQCEIISKGRQNVIDLSKNSNSTIVPPSFTTADPNKVDITGCNALYCEMPWSCVPEYTLPVMWRIVYWTSQCLTWFILPFMQSYSGSGHFSVAGKMKHALIKNAVYYGTYLIIFVILLIYVAASPNITIKFSQLKVIGITSSNTWGLFLLVLLLGYGLVEVPRNVWRASNPVLMMAYTNFKLAKLRTEKQEASEGMEDVLEEVKRTSDIVRYNHPLRKFVNLIISKCGSEFQDAASQGNDDYVEYDDQWQAQDSVTEKSLVRLHSKVIEAVEMKKRTDIQWKITMEKALDLDNLLKNLRKKDHCWTETSPAKTKKPFFCNSTLITWRWKCSIKPVLLKISAIFLTILSLMVIWSECTFFNEKPVLSLFAIFINLAKTNYSYFYIELASCAIISYLCVCAYYTIFRIKIFNIYYIAGHHQTNEPSLMFVGIMLCRLTPPMCLNFLGLIHLDTHITNDTRDETSYTEIMGHLDVIPIISKGFNVYFPILVIVLCIATFFSLGQRCLSAIGIQQFIDGNLEHDFTVDLVEEGKQLVNRELRKQEREQKTQERTQNYSNAISTRRWRGKEMRQAELRSTQSLGTNDMIELLSDTEPFEYSSIADERPHSSNSFPTKVEKYQNSKEPAWSANLVTRKTLKNPPKNLFDDV